MRSQPRSRRSVIGQKKNDIGGSLSKQAAASEEDKSRLVGTATSPEIGKFSTESSQDSDCPKLTDMSMGSFVGSLSYMKGDRDLCFTTKGVDEVVESRPQVSAAVTDIACQLYKSTIYVAIHAPRCLVRSWQPPSPGGLLYNTHVSSRAHQTCLVGTTIVDRAQDGFVHTGNAKISSTLTTWPVAMDRFAAIPVRIEAAPSIWLAAR